ncbi:transcription termination factor Rho [candidate division KSB1 bacterium]|nr:transcription termination factor Rho [candidate division KSB1 bacterium]
MDYTWEQLHKMRVADLRTIAQTLEHAALQGFSTMHKEQLVPALCHALGIEDHAHHEVVGLNKTQIKGQIRALKKERDAAIEAKDKDKLKTVRREIHHLKVKLRKART